MNPSDRFCEPIQPVRFKDSSQTDIAFVNAPLLYTQQHIMSRRLGMFKYFECETYPES